MPGDTEQQTDDGSAEAKYTNRSLGQRVRQLTAELSLTDWLMVALTAIIATSTVWNTIYVGGQLSEMRASGTDTHNLTIATQHLADRSGEQAKAMERLRQAGEAQAKSIDGLKSVTEIQAQKISGLYEAIQHSAAAADKSALAAIVQSEAIKREAESVKGQTAAVQESLIATREMAQATQESAKAGERGNEIANAAFVASERPWVSISMPVGDTEPVVGQEYKIEFSVLNVGRSPALNATTNVTLTIIKITDTFESVLASCSSCQRITIFPSGGSFEATNTGFHPSLDAAVMTADEVKRIADRKDTLLLRTRVDYTDTARNPHVTTACMYFVPKAGFTSCPVGSGAN